MSTEAPPIRILGSDPNLLQRAKTVPSSQNVRTLAKRMRESMEFYDGIGIAAPQIGEPLRVFLIEKKLFPDAIQEKISSDLFINPKIVKKSFKRDEGEEGCLSVPRVFGVVERSVRLTVEAYGVNWKKFRVTADGLLARVLQHELDHLEGKLFVHRAKRETLHELLPNGEMRQWQEKL